MKKNEDKKSIEEVNPFDYAYEPNQQIMVDANSLLRIVNFAQQVVDSQPSIGVLNQYPTNVEEVRTNEGELLGVNVDWVDHTAESFFNTGLKSPVQITTALAFLAEQIKFGIGSLHLDNIQKGIARKLTDLQEEDALSKIK